MAEGTTQKPTAEELAEKKAEKPAESAVTFPLSRVLEESDDFAGHPRYVVEGAYAGVSLDTEVTQKDVKQRVSQWLKSAEKTDDQE